MFMAAYAALDVESTGMNPRKDRIVSLAIALLDKDLNVTSSFHHRFQPGVKIPPEATARHGITDDDVKGLGMFRDVALRVRSILLAQPIIGYNVAFDLAMLHHELHRAGVSGLPPNLPVVDPFKIFCSEHPRTLTAAMKVYCDKSHPGAHDAMKDVEATLEVLKAQLGRRSLADVTKTWSVPHPMEGQGCVQA
jgi:DNA polymerase III subunit epsilon